jgi:preprotein translocase subunit SecB
MADTTTPATAAAAPDTTPQFQIQRVYLKDLSIEQPNSPAIFLETEAPQVDIQIGVESLGVADGIYETIVTGTVTTKVKDKVMFLVEAKQSGIFEIRNVPQDQLPVLLGVACPQILYPYLRANIADAITKASFPPIHLAELNFQSMYEQQLAQAQSSTGAPAGQALN